MVTILGVVTPGSYHCEIFMAVVIIAIIIIYRNHNYLQQSQSAAIIIYGNGSYPSNHLWQVSLVYLVMMKKICYKES